MLELIVTVKRNSKEITLTTDQLSKLMDALDDILEESRRSSTMNDGFYYLYTPEEKEPTLAHYYFNTNVGCKGFGFNIHDGGGFLPEHDLTEKTRIVPVSIIQGN